MKTFRTALTAAVIAVLGPVWASAADLPARMATKAPAYLAPVYNWTGFYFGGHVGGAWNGDNWGAGLSSSNNGAVLGGLQVGVNQQFAPNWVVGVEGQYSFTDLNRSGTGTGAFAGVAVNDQLRGLGSVTGRLGYATGPSLLYVKGGVGFADGSNLTAVPGPATVSGGQTVGYTVGAGLEYLFAPSWSGNVEYQYYNFGRETFTTPVASSSVDRDVHTVKGGLNYHFNWGGPAVSKY
jgi:outer membrane immunogenic protein